MVFRAQNGCLKRPLNTDLWRLTTGTAGFYLIAITNIRLYVLGMSLCTTEISVSLLLALSDLINGNPAYRRSGVRIEKAFGLAR